MVFLVVAEALDIIVICPERRQRLAPFLARRTIFAQRLILVRFSPH
jgi:hypothetical protein